MMKLVFLLIFMNLMLFKNKMIMFYYNMCYLMSWLMIYMYMYKDVGLNMIFKYIGVDYYSVWLIMMSFWIMGLMLMCLSGVDLMKIMIFLSLLLVLIMFFLSLDLLMFYFLFEVSLIPTFMLIVYWGGNPERLVSSYYLMIYMLFISFPLLIYILHFYFISMTFKFVLMKNLMSSVMFSFGGFLMIFMALYIKMPIYLMHIWLPKAHVEAPVYGSMILAGVLLKMGSYGLIRFLEMFISMSLKYSYLIVSVGIVGSLYMSLSCLVQVDMKSLVAYSSVVHMNMMLCSLMILLKLSFLSSYIMMVSHGLCSSGLFYMVNLYYERTSSRLLVMNKGMMSSMPGMSMLWFLLCIINFSFPFSLGFFSEMLMLSVILNWDMMMMIFLMMICFFSSAYSLYLFSYIQHGNYSYLEVKFNLGYMKEYMVVILHIFPLILILMNLLMFM